MSNTYIPYIVEGEILEVNYEKDDKKVKKTSAPQAPGFITYKCLVTLEDGMPIVLPRVIEASLLGGIDDYFQIRRRATHADSSVRISSLIEKKDAGGLVATVGERVYIAFINGDILRPVIIGHMQHPSQISRFPDDKSKKKPQAIFRYLGMEMRISETGAFTMIHNGAPTIKHVPASGMMGGVGAIASAIGGGAAAGAISSAGSIADKVGGRSGEPSSLAVSPNKNYPKCRTIMEFLDKGEFRVRDSIGQNIEINPDKKRIFISNNSVKSTDKADASDGLKISTNSTDAEYVLLDQSKKMILINARDTLQLYSFGYRKDITEKDHSHKIKGNESITIQGNKTDKIDGSLTINVSGLVKQEFGKDLEQKIAGANKCEISGDLTLTVKGKKTQSITGDWTSNIDGACNITAKGDIAIKTSGGGGIKVSGGKVEVGSSSAGIFDSVSQILEQLDAILQAIQQLTVPTSTGPSGVPINASNFAQAQSKLKSIKSKLDSVKGSL